MSEERVIKQTRTIPFKDLKTRSEEGQLKVIEGYFALFGSETELFPGVFEEIAPTAFDKAIVGDVRCLIDHETRLVLGRTKSNTLELRVDSTGLYGVVTINVNDSDAMNLYERVQRGDVDQCSFGFEIVSEEVEHRSDGSIKYLIEEVKLYEVSVVTFPAYKDTGVQARKSDAESLKKRQLDVKKLKLRERLTNVKDINATKEIE